MIDSIKNLLEKIKKAPSSIVNVNGHSVVGRNVTIINGKVIVDGKPVDIPEAKEIHVTVEGDLGSLKLDAGQVTVHGSAGEIQVDSGSVSVGMDVKGEIEVSQGKVTCQDVYSDVTVDIGSVKAATIHGSVHTKTGTISR